jgi:hypothetical protein
LESRRLLGFRRDRRWLIPAWQLDAEAERGVLPGLGAVQQAFPGGVVALSAWVSKASVDLAGASPREALTRGQVAEVIEVARNLTAAGWGARLNVGLTRSTVLSSVPRRW